LNTPGTRYALASLDDIAEGLTRIMNSDHEKLARRARLHAEKYSWERIIENYWKPFLEKCEIELYPKLTASGVSRWD